RVERSLVKSRTAAPRGRITSRTALVPEFLHLTKRRDSTGTGGRPVMRVHRTHWRSC
ncbi:hypothetical protein V3C99_006352, partial [Haemonchus contortus]